MRNCIAQGSGVRVGIGIAAAVLMAGAAQAQVKPVVVTPPPPVVVPKVTVPKVAVPRTAAPRVNLPNAAGPRGAATGAQGRLSGAPPRPNQQMVRTTGGGEIYRANGRVYEVHARGMEIHRVPGGTVTAIRERPDGLVVVSRNAGTGYVQSPYSYFGTTFVQRTWSAGGAPYTRTYQHYDFYDRVPLDVYLPGRYYNPAFYGWAANPWASPVVYSWGWQGDPWSAYYAAYFAPYPVYTSPTLWLADYLLSETLQLAYRDRTSEETQDSQLSTAPQEAASPVSQPLAVNVALTVPVPAPAPLTDDVKQTIAEEVQRQIALENSEAAAGSHHIPDPDSSGVARLLGDNIAHTFVVSIPLDLVSKAGECPVTEGDVLRLKPGTEPASTAAQLIVVASKADDCGRGTEVTVGVADLQEMQNRMREGIDQGLAELRAKQGHSGLPPAPAAALPPPAETGWAQTAPAPVENVVAELSQQRKEAAEAESEALKGETNDTTSASATPAVSTASLMGKSPEQVKALVGNPISIADLGAKKIYVYPAYRVTFTRGKATDIQ